MDNNNFGSDEFPIPESFGNLVKLERLKLNVNNFVDAIPTQIGNLVLLGELLAKEIGACILVYLLLLTNVTYQ